MIKYSDNVIGRYVYGYVYASDAPRPTVKRESTFEMVLLRIKMRSTETSSSHIEGARPYHVISSIVHQ